MGNIKWSALSVSEAMDKAAAEIEQVFEPLWRANAIVREACKLPNLPGYMQSRLISLKSEIDNVTGVDLQRRGSRILSKLQAVRDDLPKEAMEMEQKSAQWGKTGSLL